MRQTRPEGTGNVSAEVLVERAVKNIAIKTSIPEAEDQERSLRREYYNALKSTGYLNIIYKTPHIATNHFHKKLKPPK